MADSIPQSELDDFERELRQRGRSREDFELFPQDPVMTGSGIEAARSTVTVCHTKSGMEKKYPYMMWVYDFARDMDAGIY